MIQPTSEAFKRWWEEDWSWTGLGGKTYATGTPQMEIYWGISKSDLVQFGTDPAGRPRFWTPLHLPPFDPEGNICSNQTWEDAKDKIGAIAKSRLATNTFDFRGSVFREMSDLDLQYPLDFSSAIILSSNNLLPPHSAGARRVAAASFVDTIFVDAVNFADTDFPSNTSFERAYFLGGCDFSSGHFKNNANFDDARFNQIALFNGTNFDNGVEFNNAVFTHDVIFKLAVCKDARFGDTIFLGSANFESVIFSGNTNFRSAREEQFAFNHEVTFSRSRFLGHVDFSGREFNARPDFSYVNFWGPPLFHGSRLHPETTFEGSAVRLPSLGTIVDNWIYDERQNDLSERSKNFWLFISLHLPLSLCLRIPNFIPEDLADFLERELIRWEMAFRALRLQFSDLHNIEFEMIFYGLEMDVHRLRPNTPTFLEGALLWLFKITSEYGQLTSRPVMVFFSLTIVFGMFISFVTVQFDILRVTMSLFSSSCGFVLRLQLPFSIWGSDALSTPSWAKFSLDGTWIDTFIRVFMPLSSLGLLTVFLVALRRRFQMDRG